MRCASLFLFVASALAVSVARNGPGGYGSGPNGACKGGKCLSKSAVDKVVDNYSQLIGDYSDALADSFLADGFTDTSDSINVLAGIPLGSVTFNSTEAFKAGQSQLPKIPLVVTSTNAVTCDTIVLRWTQTFGNPAQPVSGISILVVVPDDHGDFKLKTLYTEFNSYTYNVNTGGSCTPPARQ